jgi:hypothetical protein
MYLRFMQLRGINCVPNMRNLMQHPNNELEFCLKDTLLCPLSYVTYLSGFSSFEPVTFFLSQLLKRDTFITEASTTY